MLQSFSFPSFLLCLCFAFVVHQLPGQELVANINQANDGSSPQFLAANDEWTVFFADDGIEGSALYVIDEPGASPLRFADGVSLGGANITRAYLVDDAVFLSTGFGDASQTWRADLTNGTYTLLLENAPNARSQQFQGAFSFGDRVALIFTLSGIDIWLTDGTMAGTNLAATAFDVSLIDEILSVDGLVYFPAKSTNNDISQLWRSDGTQAGTFPITNFEPNNTFVFPGNLIPYAGSVFFTASDTAFNYELYRTDGTMAGTSLFFEFQPGPQGSFPGDLQVFNDTLFFSASTSATGGEIWYTDGNTTSAYTELVSGPESLKPFNLCIGSPYSYFSQRDTNGVVSLWRTDFTSGGTFSLTPYFSSVSEQVNAGRANALLPDGSYFFLRQDSLTGQELWVTNGSTDGTKRVGDLFAGPSSSGISSFRTFEDQLYFFGSSDEVGEEIWTTSPGNEIELVLDVNKSEGSSFPLLYDTTSTGNLLFSANGSCVGRELFVSDGTAAATGLVKDINPGTASANVLSGLSYMGKRYFTASPSSSERTLYATDGTEEGTREVLRIKNPDGSAASISSPSLFKDRIYISGGGGVIGQMLLAYDPATETVDTIQQISGANINGSGFRPFALNDSVLLFNSQVFGPGAGIYRTDGTREGILPLLPDVFFGEIIRFDGVAFFATRDQGITSVWRTDGTSAETRRVLFGNSLMNPRSFIAIGDRVYFTASEFNRVGLYYFSGPSSQIDQVSPPNGTTWSGLSNLFEYNGQLFFTGIIAGSGIELLTTDGTAQGTRMVKDIAEGEENGQPLSFLILDDLLYFSAFNASSGRELYRSDGTEEGTELIADINPGPASSSPASLFNYNGTIYFSADDGISGAELWRYNPNDPTATDENNAPNDVLESCPEPTTHLNDVIPPGSITISPNPTANQTIIALPEGRFQLELYTNTGQMIWSVNEQVNRVEIDLSQHATGTYFLRMIETITGRHRIEKIIVGR